MDIQRDVLLILDNVLGLKGRTDSFTLRTRLLGALPELDSMAVVALISSLEDQFGFSIDDDEIDGADFETVGSLVRFVQGKLGFESLDHGG